MDCLNKITKTRLKQCEKSQSSNSGNLAKISCRIGGHFETAYINTGSSISIASADLYRKLIADKCTFKDGTATLNLIDESRPNQEYRITTTSVKRTILGMDFLRNSNDKPNDDAVFRVPEKPAPKSTAIRSEEIVDDDQSISLLDWILNTDNLKKPLYNILADGTADDEDLFAICAFMKRMPRMVSPIRSLEEQLSCKQKQMTPELIEASFDKIDKTPHSPPIVLHHHQSKLKVPAPATLLLDEAREETVTVSTNHDTKASKPSTASSKEAVTVSTNHDKTPTTASSDETNENFIRSSSKNPIATPMTLLPEIKSKEKVVQSPSKNETTTSQPSAQETMPRGNSDENVVSSSLKTDTQKTSAVATSFEREKAKVVDSSSESNTPKRSTTLSEKEKGKVVNSSSKNEERASRTSIMSLEKEREKLLSLLSQTTSRTTTSSDKGKAMSSSSKSQSSSSRMSSSSETSLHKEREKGISSSTRDQPTTSKNHSTTPRHHSSTASLNQQSTRSRTSTSSSDRERPRVQVSLLKNPPTTSKTSKTSRLDKGKENVRSDNTSKQVSLLKSSRR